MQAIIGYPSLEWIRIPGQWRNIPFQHTIARPFDLRIASSRHRGCATDAAA
jgi:hypothetical protein